MAQLGKAGGNTPSRRFLDPKKTNRTGIFKSSVSGAGKGHGGWVRYLLVETRGIWLGVVSGMGKTERSGNLLVMERREKKRMN